MKTNVSIKGFFTNEDYSDAHKSVGCEGHWNISVVEKARLTFDGLGPVLLPSVVLVQCNKCKAAYEAPGFREFAERYLATHLVLSNGTFTKGQIRFLRICFNLTQEEFAEHIGVANKSDMAKFESEAFPARVLSPDRQVRLKLFCAKLLELKDPNEIYGLNDIQEDKVEDLSKTQLPVEDFLHQIKMRKRA